MAPVSLVRLAGSISVIRLEGEFDMVNAPEVVTLLDQAIDDAGSRLVAVDLSEVAFLDSTLLQALVTARDRVGSSGLAGLDSSRVRMTFPCRLRVRLRSGRTLEIEGDERGSCGRPLSEQREVVEAKRALARLG
jgi:ABC-type transporter Mla MlaB component